MGWGILVLVGVVCMHDKLPDIQLQLTHFQKDREVSIKYV